MTNKTICFDLRPLQIGHENRGIGMAVKSILENLNDNENQYIFYTFKKNNPIKSLGIKIPTKNYKIVRCPTLKTSIKNPSDIIDAFKLTFHRFKPLKKYRPDAFVQFDAALGAPSWRKTKVYVIGYDLIPLIMKGQYLPSPVESLRPNRAINPFRIFLGLLLIPLHPRKIYSILRRTIGPLKSYVRSTYHLVRFNRSLQIYKKADGVLCISNSTKNSFRDLLNIPTARLHTLALAPVMTSNEPDYNVARKINKPYLFYIGGTDKRKSLQDIVRAFNITKGRDKDIALVLAGNELRSLDKIPDLKLRHAIHTSPYKDDIHLVGFVSDEEKLGLYSLAHSFVFASTYEGFGLPILEAAKMGCPVIAYNNSSIPELCNDSSSMLVDTGDFSGISKAAIELFDPVLRQNITSKLKAKADSYSWQRTTKNLLSIIDKN